MLGRLFTNWLNNSPFSILAYEYFPPTLMLGMAMCLALDNGKPDISRDLKSAHVVKVCLLLFFRTLLLLPY